MNFASILDRKAEDIQRPKNLPVGHYIASVKKLPEQEKIANGRFDTLDFQLIIQSPCEDVDPDELEAFGASPTGQLVRKRFLFNTDPAEERGFALTLNQVKTFLTNLDIGFEEGAGMTMGEALNNSVGAFIKVQVTHRADPKDSSVVYTEVGNTASAS